MRNDLKTHALLHWVINRCLMRYCGGELFFDHLDRSLRDPKIINLLVRRGLGRHDHIIVSGEFGILFYRLYRAIFPSIIVADGGLRNSRKTPSLKNYASMIEARQFVFVDDSFYSGTTRDKISSEVCRLGGSLRKSLVIYDGSSSADRTVFSLYEYYGTSRRRRQESQTRTKEVIAPSNSRS